MNKVENKKNVPKSFIVPFWAKIFEILSAISLFEFIRFCIPKSRFSYVFVEFYVIFNTIFSISCLIISSQRSNLPITPLLSFVVFYGIYRTFEIVVYQINVLLFDHYRASTKSIEYAVRGYRRIVILLIHNYFEIIFWFGVFYVYLHRSGSLKFEKTNPVDTINFFSVFRDSVLLMFSYNSDHAKPTNDIGAFIFTMHALIGVLMTVMLLARFVSILPTPNTMDEFESDK